MSNYIIDYAKLTIHNAESNGVKPIHEISGEWANHPHIVYVNDDHRKWYQAITGLELRKYYAALNAQCDNVEASYTASELGLGEGLLL